MAEEQFTSYPVDHIIFVVDEPDELDAIADALRQGGKDSDDLKVLAGPEGAARLDSTGRRGGMKHRIRRLVGTFGDEHGELSAIEEELQRGAMAMAVAVRDEEDKQELARLLRGYDVRHLRFYGRMTVEDLSQ